MYSVLSLTSLPGGWVKILSRPGLRIVRVAFPMFQIHIEMNPVLGKRLHGLELLQNHIQRLVGMRNIFM